MCCGMFQKVLGDDLRVGGTPKETRLVVDFKQPFDYKILPKNTPGTLTISLPKTQKTEKLTKGLGRITGAELKPIDATTTHLSIRTTAGSGLKHCFRLHPTEPGKPYRLVVDIGPQEDALPPPVVPKPLDKKPQRPTEKVIPAPPLKKSLRPVIAIDPGHGGIDPGTIGLNGVREKDVTLAMALELQRQLVSTGRYRVVLTRDRDVFLPLKARVTKARKAKADLFISLHADSHPNPETKGMCVYTLSKNRSDREAERLAARENKADLIAGLDLSTESTEVTNILIDLAQRDSMNLSSDFAQGFVESLQVDLRLPNKPHRLGSFAVLTAPDIPSILIELGYLSNREEAQKLSQSTYRRKLSLLLKNAVDGYYRNRQV